VNLIRARLAAWVGVTGALIGVVGNLGAGNVSAAVWAAVAGAVCVVLAITFRGWQVDRGLLNRRLREGGGRGE
jgi:O-antigen/teichoic acid export membrane protein